MPKKRSKNGEEYYRGIIRGLKAEVKRLKQQLKTLERREHHFENIPEDQEIAATEDEDYEVLCDKCFKGKMKEISVAGRYWTECDLCDNRTKTIKTELK